MLSLQPVQPHQPLQPRGTAPAGEATHTVRHATVTVARAEQAALLRTALPLALQGVLDAVSAAADQGGPVGRLWLLQRLPCRLRLPAGADLQQAVQAVQGALHRAWADALPQALRADEAGRGCAVLALDDAAAALAEAWTDALSGRHDRAWAWAQLGFWPADTSASAAERLSALLLALDRQPLLPGGGLPEVAPALRRRALLTQLLQQGLLPRALSQLAPALWLQLAQGLPGHGALAAALAAPAPRPDDGTRAAPGAAGKASDWPAGAEAAACRAALALAPLPGAARRTAALWLAWLAQLQADPGALASAPQAAVQAQLQVLGRGALQASGPGLQGSALRQNGAQQPLAPAAASGAAAAASRNSPLTTPTPRWPTRHAGLLHLLPLLPGTLPPQPGGLTRTRLLRLAVHGLRVPLNDAVLAPWLGATAPAHWAEPGWAPQVGPEAWPGAWPGAGPGAAPRAGDDGRGDLHGAVHSHPHSDPRSGLHGNAHGDPHGGLHGGLHGLQRGAVDPTTAADVAALAQALQERLQRHLAPDRRADLAADLWPWLLRRPATLHALPGRWEACFEAADTRLRLCGLDRDPGFLPWLGLSVVLRYE